MSAADLSQRPAFVEAVQNLQAVPTLLQVLCDTTGMGFAAVARVTDDQWLACAVLDRVGFGLKAGEELDIHTTLCKESRELRAPVVIDHASRDPVYCGHHTPRLYRIESYVSVPIVLPDGEYFGNLCAIDAAPADVSNVKVQSMFVRFADLIALQLGIEMRQARTTLLLDEEREEAELREQFVAVLGHDLRNPVAAVIALTDILHRKAEDPAIVRDVAHRLKTSAKRMSALIDDVLDFARVRLGDHLGVAIEPVELGGPLANVVGEFRAAHPLRRIEAEIARPLRVACDPGRIQQVASNLLGNAAAHGAPEGSIRLAANVDGANLVLTVWNDGEPIGDQTLSNIFRPFSRNSSSRNRQGLGLGLHICNEIVAAHGGRLSVTSSLSHGTLFTVVIPVDAHERSSAPVLAAAR